TNSVMLAMFLPIAQASSAVNFRENYLFYVSHLFIEFPVIILGIICLVAVVYLLSKVFIVHKNSNKTKNKQNNLFNGTFKIKYEVLIISFITFIVLLIYHVFSVQNDARYLLDFAIYGIIVSIISM